MHRRTVPVPGTGPSPSRALDTAPPPLRLQGGFSEVWLAQHKFSRKKQAIKVVYLSKRSLRPEQVHHSLSLSALLLLPAPPLHLADGYNCICICMYKAEPKTPAKSLKPCLKT